MINGTKPVKDRKELFSLLRAVLEKNRDYYSRYGKWQMPQIKVFWIEVNEKYFKSILKSSEAISIDKSLYKIRYEEDNFWIDTGDRRIWQVFTLADSIKADRMIRNILTNNKGADRIWLPEKFMLKVQKKNGYDNRGFGIRYRDILSSEEPRADFSAKLWVGRSCSMNQKKLLDVVKESFQISSLRFGKNESIDEKNLSGQLFELYYNGHMTVTTCDDSEEMFSLFEYIREIYKKEIEFLELERRKKPSFVEISFSEAVDVEGFEAMTFSGKGKLRLWLQPYKKEPDLTRYSGVDLHTGDFVQFDIAEDFSYISALPGACMNVAPRFGVIAARYMSSNLKIFHDGVELFA